MNAPRFFAVVPAAGRSRRMGSPKLLLPWNNTTIIETVLGVWKKSRVDGVFVVVHPDDVELLAVCRAASAQVVVPPSPPAEMKDSIEIALDHINRSFSPGPGDAWLLAPADMPTLSPAVINRLLDEHAAATTGDILLPTHDGKRGHPALFPWLLAADVACLGDDEGVNALLARGGVREIECGASAAPPDIDTPEDYRRQSGSGQ